MALTAFRLSQDEEGALLRIWEQAGEQGECTVSLPKNLEVSSAQPVDLRGLPSGAAIPVRDGIFSLKIEAYKPYTFILK